MKNQQEKLKKERQKYMKIVQKRYYDQTDAGTHGASCHTDINMVDFYLKE